MKYLLPLTVFIFLFSGLAFADNETLAEMDPTLVKLKILDGSALLKTNDSAKDHHYISMQNGSLVTQETAVEGVGPVCMFALGPKSSRVLTNGKSLQATKIQQGAPQNGLQMLLIDTEGDYLLVCTMNDAYYAFKKLETNSTMKGFLHIEIGK